MQINEQYTDNRYTAPSETGWAVWAETGWHKLCHLCVYIKRVQVSKPSEVSEKMIMNLTFQVSELWIKVLHCFAFPPISLGGLKDPQEPPVKLIACAKNY